ncbi:cation/H(+) antiporter 11-like [Mercurialis annua]|uniref:cation/H(+) antiporter 11-like n=1 Tax=Mercurialis annua TaxID=3986 RepID=UPI002160E817|nr:cation/H(+) antiporter 11-like [Mercurialis annua]
MRLKQEQEHEVLHKQSWIILDAAKKHILCYNNLENDKLKCHEMGHFEFKSVLDDNAQSTNKTLILKWTCYKMIPSSIHSDGMLAEENHPIYFLKHSLPLLELQIGIICILHHTIHFFLSRYGITEIVSQVLAHKLKLLLMFETGLKLPRLEKPLTGIILGPTFLGKFDFMRKGLFPHESQDYLFTFAYFGFGIFLFMTTTKLDLGKILGTGKIVIYSGIGNVLIPLFLGLGLTGLHRNKLNEHGLMDEATIVAIMQCFSTFSIIANVLEELKILNSEIGRLVLSSALVGDLLGIILLSIVTSVMQKGAKENILIDVSVVLAFSIAAAFVFRPTMLWIIRKTPQGSPVDSTYIFVIMAVMFLSQAYFHYFHQYLSVAAAILGFAVPAGPPLGSTLVEKYETVSTKFLMPIAMVQAVMRADLSLLFTNFSRIEFYCVLGLLIFGSKLGVSLLAALYVKIPLNDSFLYAALMTCRGVIELCTNLMARDSGTIGDEAFAFLTFGVFISSAFVSLIVKYCYDPSRKYAGYQARNIMCLKPKSRLRILACIHKPDHVTSVISLLDAFLPTEDRPIDIYVVHLIQLIGRATPVLISHQMQSLITDPRSQNIIFAFTQYQQNRWGTVCASTFTAINKPKIMNEDISMLALDKFTSLILLPLHRRWSIHGRVESEDQDIRLVNCKVLEKAPCSVGIFFDRGKLGRPFSMAATPKPSISICMIFLGGADDREALSLAKRIVMDPRTRLTVIHLVPQGLDLESDENEDLMIDSWALNEVIDNQTNSLSNTEYREVRVKDGPATAIILHSIVDEYDLFLLGRRHGEKSPQTLGLSEWTELSELGIIGDLFASNDLNTRAAVLVVQQQKQIRLDCRNWLRIGTPSLIMMIFGIHGAKNEKFESCRENNPCLRVPLGGVNDFRVLLND